MTRVQMSFVWHDYGIEDARDVSLFNGVLPRNNHTPTKLHLSYDNFDRLSLFYHRAMGYAGG